jgi:hypothetical protein
MQKIIFLLICFLLAKNLLSIEKYTFKPFPTASTCNELLAEIITLSLNNENQTSKPSMKTIGHSQAYFYKVRLYQLTQEKSLSTIIKQKTEDSEMTKEIMYISDLAQRLRKFFILQKSNGLQQYRLPTLSLNFMEARLAKDLKEFEKNYRFFPGLLGFYISKENSSFPLGDIRSIDQEIAQRYWALISE